MPEITVVGAGVIGLTTATVLAEAGSGVRILTDEPVADTTSMAATGMVGLAYAEPMTKVPGWEATGRDEFNRLCGNPAAGVRLQRGLLASREPADPPPPIREHAGFEPATADQLPLGFASGFWLDMIVVDMGRYLPYLSARFESAGGTLALQRVDRFDEVDAPVVVNCAGVGARELTGDTTLTSAWGSHVIVENPGLETHFMEGPPGADEWLSWMPHGDRALLGGVSLVDRWDRDPDPVIGERLLAAALKANPALRAAKVLGHNVGLRPHRPSIRVEEEPHQPVRLIHNYGHSGLGVTLSWGCANEVREILANS